MPLFGSLIWLESVLLSHSIVTRQVACVSLQDQPVSHKASSENIAIDGVSQKLRAQHASRRPAFELTSKEPDLTVWSAARQLTVRELIKVTSGQSRNHEASR